MIAGQARDEPTEQPKIMDRSFRLIPFQELDAASNMAIDEALLQSHLQGLSPPTLRFYRFAPPAVSIGYGQKLKEEEERSIRNAGFDLVRRPTGGRAVLHLDDLTYSFVGSEMVSDAVAREAVAVSGESVPPSAQSVCDGISSGAAVRAAYPGFLSASVATSYKQICQGLIEGMKTFGITLELGSSGAGYRANYDCFTVTTGADLHWQGKKMIGSAQMRRKQAVLQHGSILLNQDQSKMSALFGASTTADRHANLYDLLNRQIPLPDLQSAIGEGFASVFQCEIIPSQLSAYEQNLVADLLPKYRSFQ
jgi:lipoate-protein ligase A